MTKKNPIFFSHHDIIIQRFNEHAERKYVTVVQTMCFIKLSMIQDKKIWITINIKTVVLLL